MQKPTTLLKNFTDEVLQYKVVTRNGKIIKDELMPNSFVDFMDVGVGDTLLLKSDNYICKYIFTYAKNPKYFITYPENKTDDMFHNLGYNPIVLTRKPSNEEVKLAIKSNSDSDSTQSSNEFNSKLFIVFIFLLVLFIAGLLGILYMLNRKKYKGGDISQIPIGVSQHESIII